MLYRRLANAKLLWQTRQPKSACGGWRLAACKNYRNATNSRRPSMAEKLEPAAGGARETDPTKTESAFKYLRIWPAVIFLALLWAAKGVPLVVDEFKMWMFMLIFWGPMVCAAGVAFWWLLASRAR